MSKTATNIHKDWFSTAGSFTDDVLEREEIEPPSLPKSLPSHPKIELLSVFGIFSQPMEDGLALVCTAECTIVGT